MKMLDNSKALENSQNFGKVIARAINDTSFKERLLKEPMVVLRESGVDIPPGLEIRAVQNTNSVVYLPVPSKPSEELSDEQLEQVAGGSTAGCAGTAGTASSWSTTFGTLSSAGTAGSS